MKLFKLAKELGVSSPEVMSAMRSMGIIPPDNHFCSISDEQVDAMRRHFVRRALGGESAIDTALNAQTVDESSANRNSTETTPATPTVSKTAPTAPIVVRRSGGVKQTSTLNMRPVTMPNDMLGKSVKHKGSV